MTTNNNLPVEPIKIFGENAGQNIGQFGSALTGTPNRTGDIEQIQALNAWGNGWAGGVISERNYPALEEMTGIQKVLSYHLAYIKQKGICEWDSTVTYFANTGFCQVNGVVYQSITDNNIGNNPTEDKESTHWKKVDFGGENISIGRNVGDIFYTLRKDTGSLNGAYDCKGIELSEADFEAGDTNPYTLLVNNKIEWVTYDAYAAELSANDGVCAKFALDTANKKFKTPTLKDVYIAASDSDNLSAYIPAGVPNITGSIKLSEEESSDPQGCFYTISTAGDGVSGNTGRFRVTGFDASRSSSIYKDSETTVRPKTVCYRPMVQLANVVDDAIAIETYTNRIEEATDEGIARLNAIDVLKTTQITNCITEIPQRVNVELNDGTLTLKAGSVVIVPYGTSEPALEVGASLNGGEIVDISWDEQKLFYYVKYDEDFNISFTSSGTYVDYLCMSPSGAKINASNFSITSSGQTRPSSPLQYTLWYDTTNNIVEFYDGTTWLQYQSLPFATANVVNGVGYSSIQNIFNGFGFIGSTIWCDKGVKGLVPNGRNADGSLNNIEAATNNAIISNISKSGRSDYAYGRFIFMNNGLGFIDVKAYYEVEKYAQIPFSQAYSLTYVKDENRIYRVKPDLSVAEEPFVVTGNFEIDFSGESPKIKQITSIPKPFRALDYNNTAFIAAQSMPANGEFISLTPSQNAIYRAPGTGYFCAEGVMGAAGKFISLYNQNTTWNTTNFAGRADNYVCVYLPCIAGQTAVLSSDNIAGITKFGFMFSEGSL